MMSVLYVCTYVLVTDWVPKIGLLSFGYLKSAGKLVLRQVEHGVSSFFAKSLAYLMIFQTLH